MSVDPSFEYVRVVHLVLTSNTVFRARGARSLGVSTRLFISCIQALIRNLFQVSEKLQAFGSMCWVENMGLLKQLHAVHVHVGTRSCFSLHTLVDGEKPFSILHDAFSGPFAIETSRNGMEIACEAV